MAARVSRLYELLGAKERFALLETTGPHKDTPELRRGAFRWMNRWLKNDDREVTEPEREPLKPQQLKVFDRAPADAINDVVHERFRRPARLDLPESPAVAREWWKGKAPQLKKKLDELVFRGWPEKPISLGMHLSADVKQHGVRLRAYDFTSEEGVPLRMWLLESQKVAKPVEVITSVVDEPGWKQWLADLGPAFKDALHGGSNPAPRPYPEWNEARLAQHRKTMDYYRWAFAIVTPRGVGPTRWSEMSRFDGKPAGHQIRRRFYLLGQTWQGQQIWDVRRAVQGLREIEELKNVPLTLQGTGEMGALALYAAIFEPTVASVEMWHPPSSHRQGPALLNVLRVLDLPQAVGLVLPRKVQIHVKDEDSTRDWDWPVRLQKATGGEGLRVRSVGE
jgi:hypothetical protein